VNSLRLRQLLWVLIPMIMALAFTAGISWRSARDMAQLVQDRQLLASAQMMAGQVEWQDGKLATQTPPAALQLFASRARDSVYFQVSDANGDLLAGWPDLTSGESDGDDDPDFSDSLFHGKAVRMVTLTRLLYRNDHPVQVTVKVAESRYAFDRLVRQLWLPALLRELVLLILALILMLIGLTLELKPLMQLHRDLQEREVDDLTPLRTTALQGELQPVVETINQYALRLTNQVDLQKRFVADAAHQLRTPVALISTQLDYASHLAASPELGETLQALRASSRKLKELINQLLSLSQAEAYRAANLPRQAINLPEMAEEVLIDLAVMADDKGIDLGLSSACADAAVIGYPALVRAILFNLVDNAIRYTPRGGKVTVNIMRFGPHVLLQIDDTGPGIPAEPRRHVFERFNRGNVNDNDGFGLGLAIVGEAVKACMAEIELESIPDFMGLRVTVRFSVAS